MSGRICKCYYQTVIPSQSTILETDYAPRFRGLENVLKVEKKEPGL